MKFSESLKKNQDFRVVYSRGKSYANRLLVMYVLKNETNTGENGEDENNPFAAFEMVTAKKVYATGLIRDDDLLPLLKEHNVEIKSDIPEDTVNYIYSFFVL